jgi:sugar transferase (PEP-CTERM/EpsH1 system associated)
VGELCTELYVARLRPTVAKLRSLTGLFNSKALSVGYYRDAGMQNWCLAMARDYDIDAVVVFSSSMAQYAMLLPDVPRLVDFVDVDSAKWIQYGVARKWPLSWIYKREGEVLLTHEIAVANSAARSFFVTDNETKLFRHLAPSVKDKVESLSNGVDSVFFCPDPNRKSPFAELVGASACSRVIVFTGAMDYWPNVDAVRYFVEEVLPGLMKQWPEVVFYIVGRSPPSAVTQLAKKGVVVTGTVADVRPYLQYADVVVAPLRVARGIQNKILEAMAMARPVVTSSLCVEPIGALEGVELLSAPDAASYIQQINALFTTPKTGDAVGLAGREMVLKRYSWNAHLSGIDCYLDDFMGLTSHA